MRTQKSEAVPKPITKQQIATTVTDGNDNKDKKSKSKSKSIKKSTSKTYPKALSTNLKTGMISPEIITPEVLIQKSIKNINRYKSSEYLLYILRHYRNHSHIAPIKDGLVIVATGVNINQQIQDEEGEKIKIKETEEELPRAYEILRSHGLLNRTLISNNNSRKYHYSITRLGISVLDEIDKHK